MGVSNSQSKQTEELPHFSSLKMTVSFWVSFCFLCPGFFCWVENRECDPSPTQLPILTVGNLFSCNSSFIYDRSSIEEDSPLAHMAIDNRIRVRQEPSPSVSNVPGLITPYFPAEPAKMPQEPAVFNFRLFLFDNFRLQRGLFPDDRETEVQFADLKNCREY